jgi:hypothetical protein
MEKSRGGGKLMSARLEDKTAWVDADIASVVAVSSSILFELRHHPLG